MGDTSPVLSKRTPTKYSEHKDEEIHQPVLPVDTDGTPDLVQLSESQDESNKGRTRPSCDSNGNKSPDTAYHPLAKPFTQRAEEERHVPWPGTLLGLTKNNEAKASHIEVSDEAPLPQEFVMQFSGEVSPLLRSSKASLQEVSDDEIGPSSPTDSWVNVKAIDIEDLSDDEQSGVAEHNPQKSDSVDTITDRKHAERLGDKVETYGVDYSLLGDPAILRTYSPDSSSLRTIIKDNYGAPSSYDNVIGIGDVSPTSSLGENGVGATPAMSTSAEKLDIQAALESRIIGAGDVSPVSTCSSIFQVSDPVTSGKDIHPDQTESGEKSSRPSVERFYTAGVGLDTEPTRTATFESDRSEERPRIERFETAQEDVQGSSELTVPKTRQSASRYATVMASEPVASYKEYTGSSSGSSDDLLEVMKPQATSGALTPRLAERADAAIPAATRRVSATQLQVVHAVEEYAASESSLASWDQDSNAADAISEPDEAVKMRDESDIVTPVAQAPRNAHHGQQADQAGYANNNVAQSAPHGYFNGQTNSRPTHQTQQQLPSTSEMTVPERSKSLLSMISSAVSSTPISPASSNAGRSTPSTIHRMQRDVSNSKRTNLASMQIPEEPMSAKDEQIPTPRNEDYDLYADHNGVVKDVRDANGRPLCVAPTPNIAPAKLARSAEPRASSVATVPDDEPSRRYSFERPMSFVSGSQDDDGRPQDQINQPLAGVMGPPPIPPQSKRRSHQYQSAPSGAIYSSFEPMQDMHWPPGEVSSQPQAQPVQPPLDSGPKYDAQQANRSVHHGGEDPPIQADSQLPPQRIPPALQSEMSVPSGQPPTNGHHQDQYNQNPRMVGNVQVQPTPRNVSAPQQVSIPGHGPGPRAVSQPLVSPPLGSPNSPRNEFEYQQQMMQLQAKYPRFRGAESQVLKAQQNQQGSQQQEKPSSKPRIAAVLKGITGRTPPNASQPSNVPPAPSSLAPGDRPTDASRAESFVSAVSSMSHEQAPSIHGGPPSVATPQRPPSLGAESHYSQVSHGSTQVQPAQSRQDLTVPAIPAQYQNLQPQQTLEPPSQSGASQGFRASTSAIPDAGKKKRFSAFTGLFNKGNTGVEQLQGKFKLSREERKAQKAQRHTSQPILQSQPTQQWAPPQQHFTPQQPDASHLTVQGLPSVVRPIQPRDPRFVAPPHPQDIPGMPPSQGPPGQFMQPQMQPQAQQAHPMQQQGQAVRTDEDSAYLRTKRLTEEHQAMQASQPPRPVYDTPSSGAPARPLSTEQPSQSGRRSFQKPPSNGYYYPDKGPLEQGAYRTSQDEHQRAQRLRQEQLEVEQRMRQEQFEAEQQLRTGPSRSPLEPGAYGASAASYQSAQQLQQYPPMGREDVSDTQAARQLAQQRREIPGREEGAYGATQNERQRMQQQKRYPLPGPEAFGRSQIHYDQMQQQGPPQPTNIVLQNEHQQMPPSRQQPLTREDHILQAEQELAQHRWQQQQHQLRQFHLQQQAQLAQQHAASSRSVSGPLLSQASPPASPVVQRRLSSHGEPQYDTPPIPGAYDHVQGVFVSPADHQQQHAFTTPQSQFRRQESDPQMQPISPQVSAQSQMPPNARHHSDASTVSVVSPISGPTPEPPAAGPAVDQRPQKPRMPSISEVHQQQPERPWHMNFPAGTTEQDIVRARQKQFFEQQFASQQQAQEQRHASSPSPRVSPDKQSPPFSAPLHQPQSQGGGFREVLPRTSPLPYAPPQSAPPDQSVQPSRHSHAPQSVQSAPLHPHEGAAWPLRTSPGPGNRMSPPNLTARPQIPSVEPQTPRGPGSFDQRPPHAQDAYDQRRFEPTPPNEGQLPSHQPPYDEVLPDEAPPSYEGPGVPNEGMEKSHPENRRPPNIVTIPNERGRLQDTRPRQASLGLMQHPQPASMAASPQRTAADMGAESLRRQLLQQEEHARMERIQRTQMQRQLREREQQEREIARARALELERSVSGGGRVGSLRSVRGSHNGGTPGWERRGLQGNNNRPVFELPALEDEEPVMRATSFPGQEWVPTMYDD
ncbi:hypothetical protein N0V94_000673 [Neodidymelliopsis sp. IMI 364377]|nr:hypothetical protein N0V94_000673 [Neodidymelliopsis sp. IMI 364377]